MGSGPNFLGLDPKFSGSNPKVRGLDPKAEGLNPKTSGLNPRNLGLNPSKCGLEHTISLESDVVCLIDYVHSVTRGILFHERSLILRDCLPFSPWRNVQSLWVDRSDPTELIRVAKKNMRKGLRLLDTNMQLLAPEDCFEAVTVDGTNT
jgi:hypothetical protein